MRRWMAAAGMILAALVCSKGTGYVDWNGIWGHWAETGADEFWLAALAGHFFQYQYPVYWKNGAAGPILSGEAKDEPDLLLWEFAQLPLYRLLLEKKADVKVRDPSYALYRKNREAGAAGPNATDAIRYQGENGDITIYEGAGESDRQAYANGGVTIAGTSYRMEQLADYDFLMKEFFSVHTSTTAPRDLMDAKAFLNRDFHLEKGAGGEPQILIYHTHSQEDYAGGGTVVGMGDYLTRLLEGKGYRVIHDTSPYDIQGGKLDRSKAYNYALDGISSILNEYPSIEVILDLHRDGVRSDLHMASEVNGKTTAPVMFFNGLSQTPDGPIDSLQNPCREDNLAFSFQLQLHAAADFPGWTRKIYLKGLRYNLHLRPRSALIEVGAQTNTYEEACNAMEPLAQVLDKVLQGS